MTNKLFILKSVFHKKRFLNKFQVENYFSSLQSPFSLFYIWNSQLSIVYIPTTPVIFYLLLLRLGNCLFRLCILLQGLQLSQGNYITA